MVPPVNRTEELQADRFIVTHSVTPNYAGKRLDRFLMIYYKKRSREKIKESIKEGRVSAEYTVGQGRIGVVVVHPSTEVTRRVGVERTANERGVAGGVEHAAPVGSALDRAG